MKFLKTLLGKDKDETPTWNIRPPSERPPPKPRKTLPANENPETPVKKEVNPYFDDIALDTIQLEADAVPLNNPYETQTWEKSADNDTRKLKTIQIGEKTEKKPGSEFNPYDTGKMRRGWKK